MDAPRLLAGTEPSRPLSLVAHETVHGPLRSVDLIAAVRATGLRGRGGARFPTATKLASLPAARRRPTVLVNAAEGEPLSRKDRTLCERAPHLVLDGALACADVIGARSVTVALPQTATAALAGVRHAVEERGAGRRVRVVPVPLGYLAGEESALIRVLDDGPMKPTYGPRPHERGLGGRPTLVNNAETLAHVGLIARHGEDWFRQTGTALDPGTTLVTLAGAVARPAVHEVPYGVRLGDVVALSGSVTEPIRAVLVGGYHGTFVGPDALGQLTLDDASLATHGARLAAGIIVLLGASACPVRELTEVVGWLAGQSAGQCGPCANGLPAMAAQLQRIAAGTADAGAFARLDRWASQVSGRGACHLPDGTARFLTSGLRVFGPELARHAQDGPCRACAAPATLRAVRSAAA